MPPFFVFACRRMHITKYLILFTIAFAIFLLFLTPNVNTGDAGELATASYYLGTAHPSAYPLYLLIGKTLTFLPFGNIAFKIALISAAFGSLSLVLLYSIVLRLTGNEIAGIFSVATLFVSYSFFTQSVIAKFYPFNLFLTLLIFFFWITMLLNGYEERAVYFSAFILGLTTANHHTGLIMLAPVFFTSFFYRTFIRWKALFISPALFLAGFIINSYLIIRGGSGNFFNSIYVNSIDDFYYVLFRLGYDESSSISVANTAVSGFADYYGALKNFASLITTNFGILTYALFFIGVFYLYQKNRKVLLFALLSLLFYGPFLAKLTFSGQNVMEREYYVVANQYYLPGIALYVVFLGMGFHQSIAWLKGFQLRLISKIIPIALSLFPLVFLAARAVDSYYRTNYVPHQITKDMYSILPVNSILLSYGDDAVYQGWYMKLIGRYREDICQLGTDKQSSTNWMFQGCNKKIYNVTHSHVFKKRLVELIPTMLINRFYATNVITGDFAFRKYLYSMTGSLAHLYLPRKDASQNVVQHSKSVDDFLFNLQLNADKIISPQVCLSHFTDDLLTRNLCNKYAIHLLEIAQHYSDERYAATGFKADFVFYLSDEYKKSDDQLHYKFDITKKNRNNVALAKKILEFNKWKSFYIREN